MSRTPRLQRGKVGFDSIWKKQGQKLIYIQQLEIRGGGERRACVLEGKVVGNMVRERPVTTPSNEIKQEIAICPWFVGA